MDRHVVRYGSRVDGALSARPKQRAFMGGRRIQSQCKARAEVQAGYHNCPDCGGCAAAVSIHRAFGNTTRRHVRFSNRPSGVKHFQTVHHCNVDVTRGLALLFGIGAKALPSWDPRTRRNNLWAALPSDERQVQADMRTHLIHRPARDIFPPQGGARVSSYRI